MLARLKLFGNHDGEPTQNRFWYFADGTSGTVNELLALFIQYILPVILTAVSDKWEANRVEVEDVTTTQAAAADLQGLVGLITGESRAAFDSWGFHLEPSINTVIKRGAKRFAGVSEVDMAGNTPNAIQLAKLQALAVVMKSILVGPADVQYHPGLVREGYDNEPGTAYFVNLSDALFMRGTTQNSRKPWLSGGSTAGFAGNFSLPTASVVVDYGEGTTELTFPDSTIVALDTSNSETMEPTAVVHGTIATTIPTVPEL